MPTVVSKRARGIALLEGVIAIGVIMAGVVGSLVLVNTSIKLGRANQDKIVAQNLAREGVELVYTLRNSGSLRKVDDPLVSWSSYIFAKPLKTNPDLFLKTYNLGDVVNESGILKCKQRCLIGGGNCTTDNDDQIKINTDPPTLQDNGQDTMHCDVKVLANYLFNRWNLPETCDDTKKVALGTPDVPSNCDYSGNGGLPNVVDITTFIDLVYKQSFQFGYAYPSIATVVSALTNSDAHLDFYNTLGTTFDSDAGRYGVNHPQPVWNDPRAQVFSYLGTYVQPDLPLTNDDQATKFYRVVSLQAICRGNNGTDQEFVIPTDYGFNCKDYGLAIGWSNSIPYYYASSLINVGALVTSEVRWPTTTSPTKVRYQEYLYDWISI